METLLIVLSCVLSYLLGSLPTAVWLSQGYFGKDVRDFGSGNAGATNTFRVLGKKAGSVVMLVDTLKGWTATSFALILYFLGFISKDYLTIYELIFGSCAVLGHIFPIYIGFKGGKGVATLLGMVLAVDTEVALLSFGVFVIILLLFKYVSLGSILASLAFPLFLFIPKFSPDGPILFIFGFIFFLLVVFTHKKNIIRLMHGEESRVKIRLRR